MKKKNKLVRSSIIALGLMMALTGCGNSEQASQGSTINGVQNNGKIKFGVIVAETGAASASGKSMSEAVRLVQKQLDAQGKNIEIIVKDYETVDTNAVIAAKKLISEDKVVAVTGANQLSTTLAINEVAKENNIPSIALAPLPSFGEYLFQSAHSNETVLTKVVDYLKKNNIKSVGWTNARDAFGQSGLPVFKKLAEENGIEIVAVEDFDASATDMTVQLTKIKSKNPGAVIVWSRLPGAGIVVKNFKQLGFTVPMIQSHAVANNGFLEQVGKDGEGVTVIASKLNVIDQLPDSDQKKLLMKFRDEYSREYQHAPDLMAGYAYDAAHLISKAISEGNDTPQKIRDYLDNELGEYKGVTGTFHISKENRTGPESDGLAAIQVNQGAWKLAE